MKSKKLKRFVIRQFDKSIFVADEIDYCGWFAYYEDSAPKLHHYKIPKLKSKVRQANKGYKCLFISLIAKEK